LAIGSLARHEQPVPVAVIPLQHWSVLFEHPQTPPFPWQHPRWASIRPSSDGQDEASEVVAGTESGSTVTMGNPIALDTMTAAINTRFMASLLLAGPSP